MSDPLPLNGHPLLERGEVSKQSGTVRRQVRRHHQAAEGGEAPDDRAADGVVDCHVLFGSADFLCRLRSQDLRTKSKEKSGFRFVDRGREPNRGFNHGKWTLSDAAGQSLYCRSRSPLPEMRSRLRPVGKKSTQEDSLQQSRCGGRLTGWRTRISLDAPLRKGRREWWALSPLDDHRRPLAGRLVPPARGPRQEVAERFEHGSPACRFLEDCLVGWYRPAEFSTGVSR